MCCSTWRLLWREQVDSNEMQNSASIKLPDDLIHDHGLEPNPSAADFFLGTSRGGIFQEELVDSNEPVTDPSDPPNENAGGVSMILEEKRTLNEDAASVGGAEERLRDELEGAPHLGKISSGNPDGNVTFRGV